MSKLRRKFIAALAVLFCALLALSTALLIPENKTVEAYNGSVPATSVNELYSSSTHGFSAANLRTLYGKLVSKATKYSDIEEALPDDSSVMDVSQFAAQQDLIVEFGGKKWIAVYLSKATTANVNEGSISSSSVTAGTKGIADDGDVVLTLWLAEPLSDEYKWQTGIYVNHDLRTATVSYPFDMYGTSYIRSAVLNNGGQFWKDLTTLQNSSGQEPGNPFARFTMTGVSNNVVDYLVAPRYIGWQYSQSATVVGGNANDLCNEAWARVGRNGFGYNGFDFEGKDKYDAWKDDLVWLPSATELGCASSSNSGLWHTTTAQRQTSGKVWTRSASVVNEENAEEINTKYVIVQKSDGSRGNVAGDQSGLVRPAIHLNLTKAAEAAMGVSYDAVKATNEQNGTQVTNTETEHTFSRTYDNTKVEVELFDSAKLDVVGPYVGNNEAQSEAQFQNGIFSATKSKTDDDETYIIKVTPKTINGKSYVWDDTDQGGERYYKIKISAAEINASWSGFGASNGETVLQNLQYNPITSTTITNGVTFVDKYKIVTNSSEYLSSDSTQWDTSGWTARAEGDPYFTISQATTHRVYYEITADCHKSKRGYYDVTVTADTAKFTARSNEAVTSEVYASDEAVDLITQDKLKELFGESVDMTTTKGTTTWNALKSKVDVKLFKLVNGNRQNVAIPDNGRLDAGEYYMYLDWSATTTAEQKTVSFNWNESTYAKFEITPKPITVSIVAQSGGDLTHEYGENPVALKYSYSGLVDGDTEDDLNLGSIVIAGQTNSVRKSTPVGTYNLTGRQTEVGNYEVTFAPCEYKVTKRAVTLQLEDEEMEFGKDFGSFVFKTLTEASIVQGSIIDGDTLAGVIKSKTYSLKLHDVDVDETDLYIEEYELYAVFESDNYEFTVLAGKFTVTKANFDMSGVSFTNAGYLYDGNPHAAQISGTLPSNEISVSYRYVNMADGSESTEAPTEIGLYLVYASFTHSNPNYNEITDKVAYLRIAATQEELNQAFPDLPTDEDIANAADLAKKKQEAKKDLEEEAKKKKDEIDANPDMTDEEKQAAKDKVDEELKKGNAAIDSAKNASDMNDAFNEGKANIEKIKVEHVEESSFPWWIIALIAGLLAILAVIIIVVLKRRNSEDEEDDYYDDEYDFDESEEVEEDYEDGEDFE